MPSDSARPCILPTIFILHLDLNSWNLSHKFDATNIHSDFAIKRLGFKKKNGGLKLEQKREGYQVKLHNLSLSQKVIFSPEIFFNLDF